MATEPTPTPTPIPHPRSADLIARWQARGLALRAATCGHAVLAHWPASLACNACREDHDAVLAREQRAADRAVVDHYYDSGAAAANPGFVPAAVIRTVRPGAR